MKVNYLFFVVIALTLVSESKAQWAWRMNAAGRPVYTYQTPPANTWETTFSNDAAGKTSPVIKQETVTPTTLLKKYDPTDYVFTKALTPVKDMNLYGYADRTGKIVISCIYSECGNFIDGLAKVRNNNWGMIDTKGKEIIPAVYEEIYNFSEGLALVKLNKRYGYYNKLGEQVIPLIYYKADFFHEGLAAVKVFTSDDVVQAGFIDLRGKPAIPFAYRNAQAFSEGLAAVQELGGNNSKWGYINKSGLLVIPFVFNEARNLVNGLAAVKYEGKWGVMDSEGGRACEAKYSDIRSFSEGLARVTMGNKYGFINEDGIEISSPKYDYANDFSDGTAAVNINGLWGFIDSTGAELIPPAYESVDKFHDGVALVKKGGYGYINKKGVVIIPTEYGGYMQTFTAGNGRAIMVRAGGVSVTYDIFGTVVGKNYVAPKAPVVKPVASKPVNQTVQRTPKRKLKSFSASYDYIDLTAMGVPRRWEFPLENETNPAPFAYERAFDFSKGPALFLKGDRWGYINRQGKRVGSPYVYAWPFSEGLGAVKLSPDGKFGFIDTTGKLIINYEYDAAQAFSDGLAPVRNGNSWGFINHANQLVIPMKYMYASRFSEGLAQVEQSGEIKTYIDVTGKTIIPPLEFDRPGQFSEGLAPISLNHYTGFMDKSGQRVISLAYRNVKEFSEGIAAVGITFQSWAFIDKTGKEIMAEHFDDAYSFSEGLAAVVREKKIGFVDKTGNMVIPFMYDKLITGFKNGHARVIKDGKLCCIDRTGKDVAPEW